MSCVTAFKAFPFKLKSSLCNTPLTRLLPQAGLNGQACAPPLWRPPVCLLQDWQPWDLQTQCPGSSFPGPPPHCHVTGDPAPGVSSNPMSFPAPTSGAHCLERTCTAAAPTVCPTGTMLGALYLHGRITFSSLQPWGGDHQTHFTDEETEAAQPSGSRAGLQSSLLSALSCQSALRSPQ